MHYRHPQQGEMPVITWMLSTGTQWGLEDGANNYCHASLEWDYGRLYHSRHNRMSIKVGHEITFIRRGRLYSSCVRSSVLYGSETWPVRKENEVALQRAEMRMVRWMCDVKVKDKVWKWRVEREIRNRWYNLGTTAKQSAVVWACVAKRRYQLGAEMYGIWGGGL